MSIRIFAIFYSIFITSLFRAVLCQRDGIFNAVNRKSNLAFSLYNSGVVRLERVRKQVYNVNFSSVNLAFTLAKIVNRFSSSSRPRLFFSLFLFGSQVVWSRLSLVNQFIILYNVPRRLFVHFQTFHDSGKLFFVCQCITSFLYLYYSIHGEEKQVTSCYATHTLRTNVL